MGARYSLKRATENEVSESMCEIEVMSDDGGSKVDPLSVIWLIQHAKFDNNCSLVNCRATSVFEAIDR